MLLRLALDHAALILPMYVDVSAFIIHAISTYMKKKETIPGTEENNAQVGKTFSEVRRTLGSGIIFIGAQTVASPRSVLETLWYGPGAGLSMKLGLLSL